VFEWGRSKENREEIRMNEYKEFLGQLAEMRSELIERESARTGRLALVGAVIVIVLAYTFTFRLKLRGGTKE
jgi:hypothetical protein